MNNFLKLCLEEQRLEQKEKNNLLDEFRDKLFNREWDYIWNWIIKIWKQKNK